MNRPLTDTELENLSEHIARQMGLHFPPSKWQTLEQAFGTAARELGYRDIQECVTRFTSAPPSRELIESMACYLTIGETYFLREAACFEILEHRIIPEIIRERHGKEQRLRIWSAGCATGEEPYSIAILLHRMRHILRDWNISILATDINPHALRKAREGEYTNWSFRNAPMHFTENYFRKTGDGRFALLPAIKEMVTFSGFNLAEESFPSLVTGTNAIDVIFCRNVLMYFTPQLAAEVVARFRLCLLDGGWLFVSPCETAIPVLSRFEPVTFPDAIFYRKGSYVNAAHQESGDFPTHFQAKETINPQSARMPPAPAPSAQEGTPPAENSGETPVLQDAQALYERGAYREAATMITLLLERDKNDTLAMALLCRIYANEGRLAEALAVSAQALAADRLCAGFHYLRAVILQEQGMNDDAAAALKKALYLDQDLVLAHFALANLEQRKGRVTESRRYFDNALSLLDKYRPDEIIPESEGMFAGRLTEIIRGTTARM